MTGRVPPRQICPVCGGEHHAWSELDPCPRCKREEQQDREQGLGAILREQRAARRAKLL